MGIWRSYDRLIRSRLNNSNPVILSPHKNLGQAWGIQGFGKLNEEDRFRLKEMAEDLILLEQSSSSGIDNVHLRNTAHIMREISQDYLLQLWKLTPLPKNPTITGLKINSDKEDWADLLMIGGGLDTNKKIEPLVSYNHEDRLEYSASFNPLIPNLRIALFGSDEKGLFLMSPTHGFSEVAHGTRAHANFDIDRPGSLFTDVFSFTLNEYFRAPAIISNGKRISRKDIIDFVCYHLGGVHKKPNRGQTKKEEERGYILTTLAQTSATVRNTIFFIYMSIIQDVVKSEDIKNFVKYVESLK